MAKKKTLQDGTAPTAPARRRTTTKQRTGSTLANDSLATAAPSTAPGYDGGVEPTQAEIAEAAYYRHLRRGGAPGDEFTDWIEAERELRQRQSRSQP